MNLIIFTIFFLLFPTQQPILGSAYISENTFTPVVFNAAKIDPLPIKTAKAQPFNLLVDQMNKERVKDGLASLEIDSKLNHAAEAKLQDMRDNHYFAHTSPTGKEPFDFITTNYQAAGENLGKRKSESFNYITEWMNSPTHRANILYPKFDKVGIAEGDLFNENGSDYQGVVVLFIRSQ